MQANVTIVGDKLQSSYFHMMEKRLDGSSKFLCESTETLHTKYFGLPATQILFKWPLNTQSTHICYATKIVQRNQK